MKLVDYEFIQQGVRKLGAVKEMFQHIQDGYVETFSDLIMGIVNSANVPVILYGCVNSGAGSNYIVSAGAIFFQGEVYKVAAFNGNVPVGQTLTLTLNQAKTPLIYTDNSLQDTLIDRTIVLATGASGTGLADFGSCVSLIAAMGVPQLIQTSIDGIINGAPAILDTLKEIDDALNNDPNLATNLTNLINTKANSAQAAWQNIILTAPWVVMNKNAKYRIDSLGKVHLRGQLWTVSTVVTSLTLKIAQLPVAIKPAEFWEFDIEYYDGSNRRTNTLSVDTTGALSIANGYASVAQDVSLDGISYWLD